MAKKLIAMGARLIVKDIVSSLSDEEKWKNAGLMLITNDSNKPMNTMGKVVAVGTDPLMQENVQLGDVVYFGKFAGTRIYQEGEEYRSLEFQEILSIERED